MWVWSDELADRYPALQSQAGTAIPLVAYAVDREADLEVLAHEILGSRRGLAYTQQPEPDEAQRAER